MTKRGPWRLSDIPSPGKLKVFSCFHGGGGSSMGWRLAGFDVLGGIEIDEKMMRLYRHNLKPKHSYLMGVQEFYGLTSLPAELYELDVLDGSPPCSVFSMSGNREADWGKEREFREGQEKQRLDDLFFHFIDIATKLKPKVVVAENVKGLLLGNARGYVKEIFEAFDGAGYDVQLFLLNASRMGVPQMRERTFFIARRKDLQIAPIVMDFQEPIMTCEEAFSGIDAVGKLATPEQIHWWKLTAPGHAFSEAHPKGHWFNCYKLAPNKPSRTFVANTLNNAGPYHWAKPHRISTPGKIRLQTFPDDYDFLGQDAGYVLGMSVPPFMMARVAAAIDNQWF